ncbi:MAG: hypothetical protein AB1921_15335 [Thermodesulfobacteriota bacterium]
MPDDKTKEHTRINVVPIMTKKCPFCFTILALSETRCPSCKRKVGEPDKDGVAKVPGRWKAYVSAAAAITGALLFLIYGRQIISTLFG